MKAYIILASGFEEAEAIIPLDILRRGGVDAVLASLDNQPVVEGAHGVSVQVDISFCDVDFSDGNLLFLPGGMPGALHLSQSEALAEVIREYHAADKYLTAICAAPMVYGMMGLLDGRKATCYPGFEDKLQGAIRCEASCVVDGQFVTACGPGAAFTIGHQMLALLTTGETADQVLRQMLVHGY